ncbi:MAG: hypothetical protein AAF216_02895, partial [Pseudomonadota bacterium]
CNYSYIEAESIEYCAEAPNEYLILKYFNHICSTEENDYCAQQVIEISQNFWFVDRNISSKDNELYLFIVSPVGRESWFENYSDLGESDLVLEFGSSGVNVIFGLDNCEVKDHYWDR